MPPAMHTEVDGESQAGPPIIDAGPRNRRGTIPLHVHEQTPLLQQESEGLESAHESLAGPQNEAVGGQKSFWRTCRRPSVSISLLH